MKNEIPPAGFNVSELVGENRGRLDEFYDLNRDQPLGEGSFAFVFEGRHTGTDQVRAIKAINRKSLRSSSKYETEIAIHRTVDHPNIARLYESFEDGRSIYLVLEICTGGELFDAVLDQGPFSEAIAASMLRTMLRTVCYLHANHIAHRDLKAENWLLDNEKPLDAVKLKLIDFGLARELAPDAVAHTKAGSPYYVAPEVFSGKYGHRADVWSLGVILYMMLSGVPPFTGTKTEDVLQAVRTQRLPMHRMPKSLTANASGLLYLMLEKEPNKRPTAATALANKFLAISDKDKVKFVVDGKGLASAGSKRATMPFGADQLRSYASLDRIEKIALGAIATQVDPHEVVELELLFNTYDLDFNGVLSAAELAAGLKASGIVMDQMEFAEKVFPGLDMDNSSAIDFSEFIAMGMSYDTYSDESLCKKAFKSLDMHNSGFIESDDLEILLKVGELDSEQGSAELERVFQRCACDDERQVDFNAFYAMVKAIDHRKGGRRSSLTAKKPVRHSEASESMRHSLASESMRHSVASDVRRQSVALDTTTH